MEVLAINRFELLKIWVETVSSSLLYRRFLASTFRDAYQLTISIQYLLEYGILPDLAEHELPLLDHYFCYGQILVINRQPMRWLHF